MTVTNIHQGGSLARASSEEPPFFFCPSPIHFAHIPCRRRQKGSPLPEKAWEPGPGGGGHYNPFGLNANRRNTVRRVRDFLEVTSARVPVFHCYGLHEWAMLYHPAGAEEDARNLHQTLPLRVSQEEVRGVVWLGEGRGSGWRGGWGGWREGGGCGGGGGGGGDGRGCGVVGVIIGVVFGVGGFGSGRWCWRW